jgi:peptide/nickel transport system ATP-binding protein
MTAPLLAVRDLTVRYSRPGSGWIYAVDRVSFSVDRGEVFAIVGESGCGKTATLMALARLLPEGAEIAGGSISFFGRELCRMDRREINAIRGREIGFVFQEPKPALNPVMPVGHQVAEVVARHGHLRGKALATRVHELFDLVGIPDPDRRVRNYAHELSGGMAQRVVIAMAIACGPSLLLADEPTTALDVTVQASILRTLVDLKRRLGMTMVLVTHDLGVVAGVADRVMVMYAGRKIEEASVFDLFQRPQHPYTNGVLRAVRRLGESVGGRQTEIPGVVPTMTRPAVNCSFALRCGRQSAICLQQLPLLAPLGDGHQTACFNPLSRQANQRGNSR